jgi:hypothetical protein
MTPDKAGSHSAKETTGAERGLFWQPLCGQFEKTTGPKAYAAAGGNVEMVDPALSGAVSQKKIEEIQRGGAKTVVTFCRQCVMTIKGRARRQKIDLEVPDIDELVLQAMQQD